MIKIFFYLFLLLFFCSTAHASEPPHLHFDNSLQTGIEYDTNVYKTYKSGDADFLAKILFISKMEDWITPDMSIGWDYQGGGKKFFHDSPQDQIIQWMSVPFRYVFTPRIQMLLEPNIKYQNERDKLDAAGTDVNEDFISTMSLLKFLIALPDDYFLQPQAAYTYFHFYPDQTFSFNREEGGLNIQKKLNNFVMGVDYNYLEQQFNNSFREDKIHEIGPYFQYIKNPFISLQYAFQRNYSNDSAYSFRNHKINLLFSLLFGRKKNLEITDPRAYRFSFHMIGTLQLKSYSSVTVETPEGVRYLVTSSEDENFNNFVIKFNYHFIRSWTWENKYTRISNDLTDQKIKFSRSLYYSGLRFDF